MAKRNNEPNVVALRAMEDLMGHMEDLERWYPSRHYPESAKVQAILGKAFQEIASGQYRENIGISGW